MNGAHDRGHSPFNDMIHDSAAAGREDYGLNSAMREVGATKSPMEQFHAMRSMFMNMPEAEISRQWNENKEAIDKIRKNLSHGTSDFKSLGDYASEQLTKCSNLKGIQNGYEKLLERYRILMLIEQYSQRAVATSALQEAPPASLQKAQALNGKSAFQPDSVISSIAKSLDQSQPRKPPPQRNLPLRPTTTTSFYGGGGGSRGVVKRRVEDDDMDGLFAGIRQEPPPTAKISSTLSVDHGSYGNRWTPISQPAASNKRVGSLDLHTLRAPHRPQQSPEMQMAARAAFSRHGQINPDGLGFSHGQINPDGLGFSHGQINPDGFFNHHPKRSQNHNQNLNLVPDPSRGRTDRPTSAPAARSRGGKSKVPVEGSNRDQAIAIESSDDEDGEGDQEKGVKAWRRHSTRRSSESQIIGRMADDLTDAKRYEGYRCVYPPPLPPLLAPPPVSKSAVYEEKKPDDEFAAAAAHPDPADARATSHDGASTSAPAGPSDGALNPVKKKKEKRRVVEVVAKDFERLEALEFLNDTCIDFYLRWIEEHLPGVMKDRCYFFNSFFYKKLAEKVVKGKAGPSKASNAVKVEHCDLNFLDEDEDEDRSLSKSQKLKNAEEKHKINHDRVKNWTKGVDLFSKDYIFIPIHAGLHWSLIIVCHPGGIKSGLQPLILHFDSMSNGHSSPSIFTHLRYYLHNEWHRKMNDDPESVAATFSSDTSSNNFLGSENGGRGSFDTVHIRLFHSHLPQQDNHCDCGLFLLTYTEFFCHAQPRAIKAEFVKFLGGTSTDQRKMKKEDKESALKTLWKSLGSPHHLDFFHKDWFDTRNTGHLRDHIKHLMLKLMHEQAILALRVGKAKEHEKRQKEAEADAEEKARVAGSGGEALMGERALVMSEAPMGEGNLFPPQSPLKIPPVLEKMNEAIVEYELKAIRYLTPEDYMVQKKLQAERVEEQTKRVMEESLKEGGGSQRRKNGRNKKQVIDDEEVEVEEFKVVTGKASKRQSSLLDNDEREEGFQRLGTTKAIAALDQNAPSQDDWIKNVASDGADLLSLPPKQQQHIALSTSGSEGASEGKKANEKANEKEDASSSKHERGRSRRKRNNNANHKDKKDVKALSEGGDERVRRLIVNPHDVSDYDDFRLQTTEKNPESSRGEKGRGQKEAKKSSEEEDADGEEVEIVADLPGKERPNYSCKPPPQDDGGEKEDMEGEEGASPAEKIACNEDQQQQEEEEEEEEEEENKISRKRQRANFGDDDASHASLVEEKRSVLHGLGSAGCEVKWDPNGDAAILDSKAEGFSSKAALTKKDAEWFSQTNQEASSGDEDNNKSRLPYPQPPSFNPKSGPSTFPQDFGGFRLEPKMSKQKRIEIDGEDDDEDKDIEMTDVPKDSKRRRAGRDSEGDGRRGERGGKRAMLPGDKKEPEKKKGRGQSASGTRGRARGSQAGQRTLEACGWDPRACACGTQTRSQPDSLGRDEEDEIEDFASVAESKDL